ncbi:MAG: beta-propeller fold lactonase family protein [Methylotetracoccus sp.]
MSEVPDDGKPQSPRMWARGLMGLIALGIGFSVGTAQGAVFAGPTHSSTVALTSDNRLALVVNVDSDTLSVIQVRSATGADSAVKLAEVAVGQEPRCVAVLPDDSKAYVTNAASGDVSVISLKGANAFTVIDTVRAGTEPRGCALTPTGGILYIANHTQGTVTVIRTDNDSVIRDINVGGNPWAIAITNNGNNDDFDERVFVSLFYAETIPGGPGEGFDTGRRGVVRSFKVGDAANFVKSVLSPTENAGFAASRRFFCTQFNDNPPIQSNLFCPDKSITDPNSPVITADPQGAFPNQLWSMVIRGTRLFVSDIGAGPEPPVQFNTNVQAFVHVIDTVTQLERKDLHVNLNQDVKAERDAGQISGLDGLFGNDVVALDASLNGRVFLVVSRGGNFVFRGTRENSASKLTLNPPNIIRFKTGNLPNGVVISTDGRRAYVNNEADMSLTRINLQSNQVIAGDISASEPPEPGSFEHAVLVGKLVFNTALGTPDNGIFTKPVRSIDPHAFRGKASRDAWSSCASCHPDGLSDKVVWIFGTGPRRTLALNSFFSKFNPVDQKISNWSAVMGSVTDFNNNSRGVQGGCGFASAEVVGTDPPAQCTSTDPATPPSATPAHPGIFQHGLSQGASDALDASTLWVQTVRTLNMPQPASAAARQAFSQGKAVFAANCASCHGGAKWTKSQVVYDANPTFPANPNPAPPAAAPPSDFGFDPGLKNARAQVISLTIGSETLTFLDPVGTLNSTSPLEIRGAGRTADELGRPALGGLGFQPPSMLAVNYNGPFLHNGRGQTFNQVFSIHKLGADTIANSLTGGQISDLNVFLKSVDARTDTLPSATDEFLESILTPP